MSEVEKAELNQNNEEDLLVEADDIEELTDEEQYETEGGKGGKLIKSVHIRKCVIVKRGKSTRYYEYKNGRRLHVEWEIPSRSPLPYVLIYRSDGGITVNAPNYCGAKSIEICGYYYEHTKKMDTHYHFHVNFFTT